MRPRSRENRDLPPGMYRRKRKRKNGKVWVAYYYREASGKEVPLGGDLDLARIKWAELEAKEKPQDLRLMKAIFDRYERDVIPKKAPRTQRDNLAELRRLLTRSRRRPSRSTAMPGRRRCGQIARSRPYRTFSTWLGSGV